MAKIYKGDEGTVFQVEVGVDISSATTVELRVWKPGASSATTWNGSANGTRIDYTTVTDDLDTAGMHKLQAYVEMGGGIWRGETTNFTVHDVFE